MKTIHVVAAVICRDNKIFAAQRSYGSFKGKWEFPGGKVEPGETPRQALVREIREELDTDISVGEKLDHVEYDYPDFHLSLDCFQAEILSGKLILKEHESAKWLGAEELDSVDWLPADVDLVGRLAERLKYGRM